MTRSHVRHRPEDDRIDTVAQLLRGAGASCELVTPDGGILSIGTGSPAFRVVFKNQRALTTPLTESAIGGAYLEGDIDLEGDLIALFDVRDRLGEGLAPSLKLRFATDILLRSPRSVNARAIAHHYTHGDDFYLSFIDKRYRFYSQCLFQSDDESLEDAAEHKLETMWSALGLRSGMRLLDIGGGWGGVSEYCGARGVHVTSLTIAEDSANYIRRLLHDKGLSGEVILEDMLVHRPKQRYDHAVIFGVIEHIPNYRLFCKRLWEMLNPRGRLYLDASAAKQKYEVSAFIRRYIYPGAHSYLAVPDIVEELLFHGFEIVDLKRETHDYELTLRHWAERLDANREEIVAGWGETLYRAFRIYLWGGSHAMGADRLQAYHLVAERGDNPGPRPGNAHRLRQFLLSLR